jgi:hypothetical protein
LATAQGASNCCFNIAITLIDPESERKIGFRFPDGGRVVGDIRPLRAVISNCHQDGLGVGFGRTTGP